MFENNIKKQITVVTVNSKYYKHTLYKLIASTLLQYPNH